MTPKLRYEINYSKAKEKKKKKTIAYLSWEINVRPA